MSTATGVTEEGGPGSLPFRGDLGARRSAPHGAPAAPFPRAGTPRRRTRPGRGHRPPGRDRGPARRAHGRRRPGARRRAGGGRPTGRRHVLPQGLHPADPALPRPVPLLHVRRDAPAGGSRGAGAVPLPRRGARDRRARAPRSGCTEALFTLGDRPEDRWPEARQWLDEHGYDSTLDYVRAMAVRVLEETGLLPHLNPGVMSWAEINRLKPVVPVDGDDARDDLDAAVHREGPGALRLARQGPRGPAAGARGRGPAVGPVHDRAAGRHRRDPRGAGRLDLRAAPGRARPTGTCRRSSSRTSGPSRTPRCGTATTWGWRSTSRRSPSPGSCSGPRCGCRRRRTSSTSRSAGRCSTRASTTGAASRRSPPTTSTPSGRGPRSTGSASVTAAAGFTLRERLTVHPSYVVAGEPWIDPRVRPHVAALADDDGLARAGRASRPGCRGRSPTAGPTTPG